MKSDYIALTVLFAIGIVFGSLLGVWVHPSSVPDRYVSVRPPTTIDRNPSADDTDNDVDLQKDLARSNLVSDSPIFLPPLLIRGRSRIPSWNCRWHDREQGIKACEWPTRKSM